MAAVITQFKNASRMTVANNAIVAVFHTILAKNNAQFSVENHDIYDRIVLRLLELVNSHSSNAISDLTQNNIQERERTSQSLNTTNTATSVSQKTLSTRKNIFIPHRTAFKQVPRVTQLVWDQIKTEFPIIIDEIWTIVSGGRSSAQIHELISFLNQLSYIIKFYVFLAQYSDGNNNISVMTIPTIVHDLVTTNPDIYHALEHHGMVYKAQKEKEKTHEDSKNNKNMQQKSENQVDSSETPLNTEKYNDFLLDLPSAYRVAITLRLCPQLITSHALKQFNNIASSPSLYQFYDVKLLRLQNKLRRDFTLKFAKKAPNSAENTPQYERNKLILTHFFNITSISPKTFFDTIYKTNDAVNTFIKFSNILEGTHIDVNRAFILQLIQQFILQHENTSYRSVTNNNKNNVSNENVIVDPEGNIIEDKNPHNNVEKSDNNGIIESFDAEFNDDFFDGGDFLRTNVLLSYQSHKKNEFFSKSTKKQQNNGNYQHILKTYEPLLQKHLPSSTNQQLFPYGVKKPGSSRRQPVFELLFSSSWQQLFHSNQMNAFTEPLTSSSIQTHSLTPFCLSLIQSFWHQYNNIHPLTPSVLQQIIPQLNPIIIPSIFNKHGVNGILPFSSFISMIFAFEFPFEHQSVLFWYNALDIHDEGCLSHDTLLELCQSSIFKIFPPCDEMRTFYQSHHYFRHNLTTPKDERHANIFEQHLPHQIIPISTQCVQDFIAQANEKWHDIKLFRDAIHFKKACDHLCSDQEDRLKTKKNENSVKPVDPSSHCASYHCQRCLTFCSLTSTLHTTILGHIDIVDVNTSFSSPQTTKFYASSDYPINSNPMGSLSDLNEFEITHKSTFYDDIDTLSPFYHPPLHSHHFIASSLAPQIIKALIYPDQTLLSQPTDSTCQEIMPCTPRCELAWLYDIQVCENKYNQSILHSCVQLGKE